MSSPMKTEPIQVYEGNGVKPNGGPHPAKKLVLYCESGSSYPTGDNAYTTDEMQYGPFNGICEIKGLNSVSLRMVRDTARYLRLKENSPMRRVDIVIYDSDNHRAVYTKRDIIRIDFTAEADVKIYWWSHEE